MPIWDLAPYVFLGTAALFGLSLLIPPLADWKYKAAGITAGGVAMIVLLS